MNEEKLWDIFAESGRISDYLSYCREKRETESENDNAGGNRS